MKLTPTQDLIMEVLAARVRLGEPFWYFENRHKKAGEALQDLGLITILSGVVYGSWRAFFTRKGIDEYLKGTYQSPLEKELVRLRTNAESLAAAAWQANDKTTPEKLEALQNILTNFWLEAGWVRGSSDPLYRKFKPGDPPEVQEYQRIPGMFS